MRRRQRLDLLLHSFVLGNLRVEEIQRGVLPVRPVLLDEIVQRLLQIVAPKVLVLGVRFLEGDALRLVAQDDGLNLRHGVEHVEILLELERVVTLADVEAFHQRADVLESAHPPVEVVAHAIASRGRANLGRPLNLGRDEFEAHLDEGRRLIRRRALGVNLLGEVGDAGEDGGGETLHDDFVDVLRVHLPGVRGARDGDRLVAVGEELGDLHRALGDFLVSLLLQRLLHLAKLVHLVRLTLLAVDHQVLLPLQQHLSRLGHVALDRLEDVVELLHRAHHLLDVIVDLVRVPVERDNGLLKHVVDRRQPFLHQRTLHGQQRAQDVVVRHHDQVEVARLLAERLAALVRLHRRVGHRHFEKQKIFHLAEQLHEHGIEVHA